MILGAYTKTGGTDSVHNNSNTLNMKTYFNCFVFVRFVSARVRKVHWSFDQLIKVFKLDAESVI